MSFCLGIPCWLLAPYTPYRSQAADDVKKARSERDTAAKKVCV